MGLAKSELETIITRASDEKHWHVFSEDPSMVKKLTRQYGEGKKVAVGPGLEWLVSKTALSFRKPTTESKRAAGRKAWESRQTVRAG